MFRNSLAAAFRNLARNPLQAFLNVAGLAIGLAAALLAFLYFRHETSYDRFIQGNERVHVMVSRVIGLNGDMTPSYFAEWIESDFPQVQAARLMPRDLSIRNGDVETMEKTGWADPDLFSLLPLPVVSGDLATALSRPDAIVLTRRMARKYFGNDAPIGKILEIDRKYPLQVTAVIEDLPAATHLAPEIYGSARNPEFGMQRMDERPYDGGYNTPVLTYVALRPGAATSIADLQRAMPAFVQLHLRELIAKAGVQIEILLVPLARLHLYRNDVSAMKPHGSAAALAAIGGIGVLIVLLAIINFVNLSTARSTRRAVEIGVRKVSGATRRHLIAQFIGETLIYAVLGMVMAIAIVELTLPVIDAQLAPGLAEQWRPMPVLAAALILTLAIAFLGGAYPAFVLSAFRPASVLKGYVGAAGSSAVCQGLVVLQFAVLIGLLVATLVIYRQTIFGLRDGLRVAHDQILLVYTPCRGPFIDQVQALPGVTATACSARDPLNAYGFTQATRRDGTNQSIGISGVGFGYFELYGISPVAGRLLDRGRDGMRAEDPRIPLAVLNETAVHALGFASPEAAIGQSLKMLRNQGAAATEIVGVVPDFAFDLKTTRIPPIMYAGTIFDADPVLNVKLSGRDVPETLDAIDTLWKRVGEPRPIRRIFVDQHLQSNYAETIRVGRLIGGLSITAIIIACFGLFGLAAFTAERRIKEIGIRKAMGADTVDTFRLLSWEFAKPVLWANLIAWPIAYYFMNRWLSGFAYHIDLEIWIFLAAGALALVIALVTVSAHTVFVARAKPVAALRYE